MCVCCMFLARFARFVDIAVLCLYLLRIEIYSIWFRWPLRHTHQFCLASSRLYWSVDNFPRTKSHQFDRIATTVMYTEYRILFSFAIQSEFYLKHLCLRFRVESFCCSFCLFIGFLRWCCWCAVWFCSCCYIIMKKKINETTELG